MLQIHFYTMCCVWILSSRMQTNSHVYADKMTLSFYSTFIQLGSLLRCIMADKIAA